MQEWRSASVTGNRQPAEMEATMAKTVKRPPGLITAEAIRVLATPESFERGGQYCRDGAVSQLVRRGAEVYAEVEGSEIDPYEVTVRLHGGGIAEARCSCPYEGAGYCKHIVATLLKVGDKPAEVVERPTIAELLAGVDKDTLTKLLITRIEIDPGLAKWIEAELATGVASDVSSGQRRGASVRRTLVDQAPIRELAETLIRGRYRRRRYWDDYRASGSEQDLQRLVEKAVPFLEAGDGRNALRVLEPIVEAYVTGWLEEAYTTDEDMYLLFDDIARLIAEASLMGDLSADERHDFAELVEHWHDRLDDYGVDSFLVAMRAFETGWEEPKLRAVLAGEEKSWPPSGQADGVEAALTAVRLRVLDACGRSEEYLHLAKAAGSHTRHAAMLVELGRVDEAMIYAHQWFKAPSEAHDLAKVLRDAGDDSHALKIADAGLALVGDQPELHEVDTYPMSGRGPHGLAALAHWLRDYAGALGKRPLALRSATVAFEQTHSLEDFRAAETWARSKNWAKVRADLLVHLRQVQYAPDRTCIYLDEGLIDDAVRSAGKPSEHASDTETLMRLAHTAHASHANWVIAFAGAKAAAIMDNNRAQHYAEAAQWLEKVALAYDAAGRNDQWANVIAELIDKHRRKYKLRPLLDALR